MLRSLKQVKLIGLLTTKNGTSHERVGIADFRSVSDMIETPLPATKIDKTNSTRGPVDIHAKLAFDPMATSQVNRMGL